jgi:hypothetical protein
MKLTIGSNNKSRSTSPSVLRRRLRRGRQRAPSPRVQSALPYTLDVHEVCRWILATAAKTAAPMAMDPA